MKKLKNQKKKLIGKKKENKKFASKDDINYADEYIDYAFGSDPILCQALKNCIEE